MKYYLKHLLLVSFALLMCSPLSSAQEQATPQDAEQAKTAKAEVDYTQLLSQLHTLAEQTKQGIKRQRALCHSLKDRLKNEDPQSSKKLQIDCQSKVDEMELLLMKLNANIEKLSKATQ